MEKVFALLDSAVSTGFNVALIGEKGAGKGWSAQLLKNRMGGNRLLEFDFHTGESERRELLCNFISAFSLRARQHNLGTDALFLKDIQCLDIRQMAFLWDALSREIQTENLSSYEALHSGLISSAEPAITHFSPWGTFLTMFFPIEIPIPALRTRTSQFPKLVRELLDELCLEHNKRIRGVDDSTMEALQTYSWPGNVSELKSVLGQACLLTRHGGTITVDDFASRIHPSLQLQE